MNNAILYCSSLCSDRVLNHIHTTSKIKPLYSIQKFHRLVTTGLQANGLRITSLTAIPISSDHHKKKIWCIRKETENNIRFIYLPFINITYFRQVCIAVASFFYTAFWIIRNRKNTPVIIVDVLNVALSVASLIAAKILRVKTCAIITDIPVMLMHMSNKKAYNFLGKLAVWLSTKLISSYDYYVMLTEQMNHLANPKNKPYCIIEGLVDSSLKDIFILNQKKPEERIILYAGSLYEKYGIKKLLDAFIKLQLSDIRLHIYGDGEMAETISEYTGKDNRMAFFGVVPNHTVVEKLREATLLVNPRPSNEEFTKYSFPSKNMEYMASGTPLVTTPLPGMPQEYYQYVFIFDDESVEGIFMKLKSILSLSQNELSEFGMKAREFVLNQKNNIIQARKLIQMLYS